MSGSSSDSDPGVGECTKNLVKVNYTSFEELVQVKGIGQTIAELIISLRMVQPWTRTSLAKIPKVTAEMVEQFDFSGAYEPTVEREMDFGAKPKDLTPLL